MGHPSQGCTPYSKSRRKFLKKPATTDKTKLCLERKQKGLLAKIPYQMTIQQVTSYQWHTRGNKTHIIRIILHNQVGFIPGVHSDHVSRHASRSKEE